MSRYFPNLAATHELNVIGRLTPDSGDAYRDLWLWRLCEAIRYAASMTLTAQRK